MTSADSQFGRKISAIVANDSTGIELADFRLVFDVQAADQESPNNLALRVYNLSAETVLRITSGGEYKRLVVNAGYESNFGVIFDGTVKQFRIGRDNPKETYLDILAADWDIGYNFGFVNTSLQNPTPGQVARAAVQAMIDEEIKANPTLRRTAEDALTLGDFADKDHVPMLRGKVLFGMARARLRDIASTLDATWSIQDGVVQILPQRGYSNDAQVSINRLTGMIGVPEQTPSGIVVKCLLNPRIRVGGVILLNSDDINQLMQADPNGAPVPYNQYTGFQHNTRVSSGADGAYRVYAIEHEGDTRGQAWYSTLTCLAMDLSEKDAAKQVIAKN